jgi:hypothetical protein
MNTHPQTRPEMLLDILCQHPYFEQHPRPSIQWLRKRQKQHATSMTEMEQAICNIVNRPEAFPNPVRFLEVYGMAFRDGKNTVRADTLKKKGAPQENYEIAGYAEAKQWFDALLPGEQDAIKQSMQGVLDWYKRQGLHDVTGLAKAMLVRRHALMLDKTFCDFALRYNKILEDARACRDLSLFGGSHKR